MCRTRRNSGPVLVALFPVVKASTLERRWEQGTALAADHLLVVATDAIPLDETFPLAIPLKLAGLLNTLGFPFVTIQIQGGSTGLLREGCTLAKRVSRPSASTIGL